MCFLGVVFFNNVNVITAAWRDSVFGNRFKMKIIKRDLLMIRRNSDSVCRPLAREKLSKFSILDEKDTAGTLRKLRKSFSLFFFLKHH